MKSKRGSVAPKRLHLRSMRTARLSWIFLSTGNGVLPSFLMFCLQEISRFRDTRACHSKLADFSTLWWCHKLVSSSYQVFFNTAKCITFKFPQEVSHCPSFSCVIFSCEMLNSTSVYRDSCLAPFPGQFFEEGFRFNDASGNAGCAICASDVNANVSENVKKAVHKNEERIRRSVLQHLFLLLSLTSPLLSPNFVCKLKVICKGVSCLYLIKSTEYMT